MKKNDIHFFLQARLNSSRLPNKVLISKFREKNVIEIIVNNLLNEGFFNTNIVLLTTSNMIDDKLVQLANKLNINFFRGDENDVLGRFQQAAEKFKSKHYIRICCDNPFLQIDYLKEIIDEVSDSKKEYDYCAHWVNNKPSILQPFGVFCEYINYECLKKLKNHNLSETNKEHVTQYIYQNPHIFKIKWISKKIDEHFRLTLDTEDDLYFLEKLYEYSYPNFKLKNLLYNIKTNNKLTELHNISSTNKLGIK